MPHKRNVFCFVLCNIVHAIPSYAYDVFSNLIYSSCFENCHHHLKRSLVNCKLQRSKSRSVFHSQKRLYIFFMDDTTKPGVTLCNRFFVVWLTECDANQTMKHVKLFFLPKKDVDFIFHHHVTYSHRSIQRSQSEWMSKYRPLCGQTLDFRNIRELK